MWPPFPCVLPNIAVPEEGQQFYFPLLPRECSTYYLQDGIYTSFELGTWTLLLFFYQPQNSFFKDVYDELNDPSHRVD